MKTRVRKKNDAGIPYLTDGIVTFHTSLRTRTNNNKNQQEPRTMSAYWDVPDYWGNDDDEPDLPYDGWESAGAGPDVHGVVPPAFFDELIYSMCFDREYGIRYSSEVVDLFYDIMEPLHPYFETLTPSQLERLAIGILMRRDYDGDLGRSLIYLLETHYATYMEHIYPIIKNEHKDVHVMAMKHVATRWAEKCLVLRLVGEQIPSRRLPVELCDYIAHQFLDL